jgi:hypothetical protein
VARSIAIASVLLALLGIGCGDTLVDHLGAPVEQVGVDAGGDDAGTAGTLDASTSTGGPDASSGLQCNRIDNPCLCEPCQSQSQCAANYTCAPVRRQGVDCGFNACVQGAQ